jgi:hypothetical protein
MIRGITAFCVLAGILAVLPPAPAGAQPSPTLDDAKMSYSMEKWQGALVVLDLLISKQKVTGAELAEAYAFKGRCLVHLERPAEAEEAFRLAHGQNDALSPDASWTPEEAAAYARAIELQPAPVASPEPPPEPAPPGSRVGQFYLRGAFGRAGGSFNDLNGYIDTWNQALVAHDYPGSFEKIGAAWAYELEAGYRLSDDLSVGIGFSRGKHSVDSKSNSVSLSAFSTLAQEIGVTVSEVAANLTWWMPSAKGVFFGIESGMGFGKLTEKLTAEMTTIPDFTTDAQSVTGEFTGSGLCGGLFGGYELDMPGFSVHVKGGYRFRGLGEFKGKFAGGTDLTTAQEESNNPYHGLSGPTERDSVIKTDASGVFLTVGMGFWFGGK